MAFQNQILLFISLSFLVFQFNIASSTPSPTRSPIVVSSISLPPNGSPSSSPAPAPSQNLEMPNDNVQLNDKEAVHHYVDALMQTSVTKTEQFINNVVEKRLTDPATDVFIKDCLSICKEVYGNAVDAMKETRKDLDNGAYYSANVDLSALATDLDTCKDCVKEIYGDDQEFTKFGDWAEKVANDALAKVVGYSS